MEHSPKIKALMDQVHSGKLQSDKARILSFIKQHPGQNKVLIGKYLNLPHQSVTARLSDLEDIGLIEAKAPPGATLSQFYFIEDPQGQKIHRAYRSAVKLEQWAKKGLGLDISENMKKELEIFIAPKDVQVQR